MVDWNRSLSDDNRKVDLRSFANWDRVTAMKQLYVAKQLRRPYRGMKCDKAPRPAKKVMYKHNGELL